MVSGREREAVSGEKWVGKLVGKNRALIDCRYGFSMSKRNIKIKFKTTWVKSGSKVNKSIIWWVIITSFLIKTYNSRRLLLYSKLNCIMKEIFILKWFFPENCENRHTIALIFTIITQFSRTNEIYSMSTFYSTLSVVCAHNMMWRSHKLEKRQLADVGEGKTLPYFDVESVICSHE